MSANDGSAIAVDFGRYLVGAGLVLAALFAVLDPSPSAGLGLPARLAFWLLHAYAGLGALVFAQYWIDRAAALRRRPWLAVTLAGLAGSLLFAPVAFGLESLFGQQEDFDGRGVEDLGRFGLAGELLSEATEVAPAVTVTWIILQLPWLMRLDFRSRAPERLAVGPEREPQAEPAAEAAPAVGEEPAAEPEPVVESEPPSDFFATLPQALGRDVAALSSELHYLRVKTPRGNALVLYNLKDAVADLESRLDGLQVHRSHWVASDHVRRMVRRGSGWACELSTGDLVPVSRRKARLAREAFGEAAEYRAGSGAP